MVKYMNVTWNNYLWDEDHIASISQVEEIESKLNIKFPEDYLDVASQHQGKTPVPCGTSSGSMLTILLHFENDPSNKKYTSSIIRKHEIITREKYSPLIIPFAKAGGASLFCLDFRDSKNNPSIIFLDWDYFGDGDEDALHFVAKNFTEFLSMFEE